MNIHQVKRIHAAMDHVIKCPGREHTLGELASIAHYSRYHFLRTFKVVTRQTPTQFVLSQRLDRAARLLIYNRKLSVTEVSMDCGFSSPQHFARTFRPMFGLTPGEARGNLRFLRERSSLPHRAGKSAASAANSAARGPLSVAALDTRMWADYGVELRRLPSYRVAYFRTVGPYDVRTLDWSFDTMSHWLRANTPSPLMLGVPRSNASITPSWRCVHDVCGVLPEDVQPAASMGQQTLHGGLAAVYRCDVPNDSLYSSCRKIWTWLTNEWLPTSQYQPDDRPPYEIYLKGPTEHPSGTLLMEFCLPVLPLHEPICTTANLV